MTARLLAAHGCRQLVVASVCSDSMEETGGALVISIRQRLLDLPANPLGDVHQPFTIFRVPPYVRERNKAQYEPQIVSIGPYHRKDRFDRLRPMEEHKWRCLHELLSQCPNNTLEICIQSIKTHESRTRLCYAEKIDLTSDQFTEMLLLDACFILRFTIEWHTGEYDAMFQVEWTRPLIKSDLLLMENQIPFFLLHSVFALLVPRSSPHTFMELVSVYLMGGKLERPLSLTCAEVRHLLHLYHSCYIFTMNPPNSDRRFAVRICSFRKLLRLFCFFCWCIGRIFTRKSPTRVPYTIPCATELQDAGVRFKKVESGTSFLDVRFRDGTMEIPQISIENSTISRLMNLVAFEQCNDPEGKKNLSSYAAFMDCLVNTEGDVAILEEYGILENMLPSREEAAKFFNQLSECVHIDLKTHYLAGLFLEVNQYCEVNWHKYRARMMRDYFSNPWAIMSFVAAIILLLLTVVQTFFAVFSYVKPPK